MDVIQSVGSLALGSRLRRISDYFMKQGSTVYALYSLEFDPVNFPVYRALGELDHAGIMELAQTLQLTHPAIIKQARELEKQGLVVSRQGETDKRRRWLSLSDKGRSLLPDMQTAWADIQTAIDAVLQKSNGRNFLEQLDNIERSLAEVDFVKRVEAARRERVGRQVEIIDYRAEYAADFARINYEWIRKYFSVEEPDRRSLDEHKAYILDKGGWIHLARLQDSIVGTVALIAHDEGVYELAKMGVDEKVQGYGIGKRLGEAAIMQARKLGGRRLFLESNRKLKPALQLYSKLGFREVSRTTSRSGYSRCDIVMEMYL